MQRSISSFFKPKPEGHTSKRKADEEVSADPAGGDVITTGSENVPGRKKPRNDV
jgi:hypothetical protein